MEPDVRIREVELWTARMHQEALERFYVGRLGLGSAHRAGAGPGIAVGDAQLRFSGAEDTTDPFYHVAFLVPGNRFDAARDWLASSTPLLSRGGEGSTTFAFESWDAQACYALDPAGNIIELIAHRGIEDSSHTGPFHASELRGVSEAGLVATELGAAVQALAAAGLRLWSGDVQDQGTALGFVGRQAHTLILCSPGRGWLPTDRPAEIHPATVAIDTADGSTVRVSVTEHGRITLS
jgi:catechol 2,3-dioxygenase-like lactoylglutathione lyase family enzyme